MRKSMIVLMLLFSMLMLSACSLFEKDFQFTNELVSKNLPEEKLMIGDSSVYVQTFPDYYQVIPYFFWKLDY